MELILVVGITALMASGLFYKSRLAAKTQLIIVSLAGALLLIWFWTTADSLHWQIIMSVVVVGSFIAHLRKYLKEQKPSASWMAHQQRSQGGMPGC